MTVTEHLILREELSDSLTIDEVREHIAASHPDCVHSHISHYPEQRGSLTGKIIRPGIWSLTLHFGEMLR